MKHIFTLILAAGLSSALAQPPQDVVDVAIGSPDHTTLMTAVKAADLVTTLREEGPFTIFAPTNAAFDKLPGGTVENLQQAENKIQLSKILTYHVVNGNLDSSAIYRAIEVGNGKAVLTTVGGGALTVSMDGNKVILTDEGGNAAYVLVTDLRGSNGVVHVIDTVMMPK
jgi:uncharacterized surface protein with fasciclin (FAS1) repeats